MNVVVGVALDCRSKALLEESERDSNGCAYCLCILSLQLRDSKCRNESIGSEIQRSQQIFLHRFRAEVWPQAIQECHLYSVDRK